VNRVAGVIDSRGFRMGFGAFSALVLLAGLLVFLVLRSHPAQPVSAAQAPGQVAQHGPPIAPPAAALRTARTFVRTAVLRTDLETAWGVTGPALKRGYTKSRWLTGNIPVVPFPADAFSHARFKVVRSYADDILILVFLESKPGRGVGPSDFFLELTPVKGRWLVSYWAPRGHSPPLPAAP
jgi:hypothetical protein